MLTAVHAGRLSLERLIELMVINPRRIFNLPEQPDTYIEVDPQAQTTISNQELHTRCGWTPFAGMTVTGRLQRVVLRGQTVYDASPAELKNRLLARPGSGQVLP